jgi:hypothetical protein
MIHRCEETNTSTRRPWPCRAWLLSLSLAICAGGAAGDLERDFGNPPDCTRPRCYWYWMDGHITPEGITRDLEAMKRVGIGEGYIGVISGQSGSPANPNPKALTDAWWANIEHAVREGGRLGVDVGLFNSPGWSQSGGPWVKPSQSMRYVVAPELRLHGPQRFEGKLPVPPGDFQDIAVLAFPAGEEVLATETGRTPTTVDFAMPAPFTARSITVRPARTLSVTATMQASDDGREYRPVKTFAIDRHRDMVNVGPVPLAPVIAAFPATTARFFRLSLSSGCALADVRLSSAPRVASYAEKSLLKMFQEPLPPFDYYTWPAEAEPDVPVMQPEEVRDISKYMTADGTLRWDPPSLGSSGAAGGPAGEWVVLRVAMTPTGTRNSPAPEEATGLEVDKMNRVALKSHFDAYVGELLRRLPPAERKAWKHVVADSYEMGPQNWTDDMAADFRKRYGYDPLPFLPVLTGRMVGGADRSDRFLWDLRRYVADRVSHDYVGGLRDLCREHGLKMWLENYGHWGFPGEFLQYGGQCDEISGEFWVSGDLGGVELRDAASAAHTYGMPVVWAEAFTGGPAFVNTPRDLKARGDWAFCEGINQFVLHVYIHQPWEDKRPGINAWFGTEFNRHNTWFEYSKPWIDYLRRCSVMLQAGLHVADVAYFIGEDAPKMAGIRKPELPAGHDFDYINADVIENRLTVKDGRLVLPDGMSYRLLALPESKTMRPALLKKIGALVADGAAILGPAPVRSPSLENFPACDQEVKTMAAALWGNGKVMSGIDLSQAFARMGIAADVLAPQGILWKHRRSGDADIYFLSNQSNGSRVEGISFRARDRAPEFWWPESGRIDRSVPFEQADGRIRVQVPFDSHTSVFVVFRRSAAQPPPRVAGGGSLEIRRAVYGAVDGTGEADVTARLASSIRDGRLDILAANDILGGDPAVLHVKQLTVEYVSDGKPGTVTVPENARLQLPAGTELAGSWEVRFPSRTVTFDALSPWSSHADVDIRHYSGVAVYAKSFTLGEVKPGMVLDLGTVNAIARVRVNGREAGTLWKPPYAVNISAFVRSGSNTVEIEVVDTWHNRLVGDQQPGITNRATFITTGSVDARSPLQPSGLLGPVTLRTESGRTN